MSVERSVSTKFWLNWLAASPTYQTLYWYHCGKLMCLYSVRIFIFSVETHVVSCCTYFSVLTLLLLQLLSQGSNICYWDRARTCTGYPLWRLIAEQCYFPTLTLLLTHETFCQLNNSIPSGERQLMLGIFLSPPITLLSQEALSGPVCGDNSFEAVKDIVFGL